MKWIFYVVVFVYMFYRADTEMARGGILLQIFYGLKTKDANSVTIEPVKYDANNNIFFPGTRKSISCKGVTKNQKMEWVDPEGNVVNRVPTNRVFVQEHFVSSFRTRVPEVVLVFTRVSVEDSGVWECHSGGTTQSVSLCVIDPSQFVDTPTVVTVDRGRSITLSCQARGEPEPRVQWYRNGDEITDARVSSKYKVMEKYNSQGFEVLLTITSLDQEDAGVYTCDAIQESLRPVENCSYIQTLNVSLLVNYAPVFIDGNDITVYVTEDESVDLTCSASGYPMPTYRWFKETGNTLSEFGKEKIQLEEEGAKAVVNIPVNASILGQSYRCRATNTYGDADKVFLLLKREKPRKPTELLVQNSTAEEVQLQVNWLDTMLFPVTGMKVQCLEMNKLKRNGVPREGDWKRSGEADLKREELNELKNGFYVTVPNLDEEKDYWIRLRAVNDIGESPWSEPVKASTVGVIEEQEDSEDTEETEDSPTDAPVPAQVASDATFYGVFFAGAIIIVALAFMFVMRMV